MSTSFRSARRRFPLPTDRPPATGRDVDVSELRRQVGEIRWFHSIDLGHGIVTPGVDPSSRRVKSLGLPSSLKGLTVLDIGTWNGFYAFEAERRGAERVVATDTAVWRDPSFTRSGFDLAHEALSSRVDGREVDVMDLSPESVGTFDLVLFLGVLYHLQDPILALNRVASVTNRQLIMETHVDMLGSRRPVAAFYPNDELKGDGSNWWGPNPDAAAAMLKAVGFSRVETVSVTPLVGRIARAAMALRNGQPALTTLRQGRAVFHAFK